MTTRYLLAQPEHEGEPWTLWDTTTEPWTRLAAGTRGECLEALRAHDEGAALAWVSDTEYSPRMAGEFSVSYEKAVLVAPIDTWPKVLEDVVCANQGSIYADYAVRQMHERGAHLAVRTLVSSFVEWDLQNIQMHHRGADGRLADGAHPDKVELTMFSWRG